MKNLKLFEEFINELSDKEIRYWALYAHISDFLSKAKNVQELVELKKKAIETFKNTPMDVINFFYQYFVGNIKVT